MRKIKRRKAAADRKEIVLKVCVTKAERDDLEAAAAAAGLPISSWVRSVALRQARSADAGKPDP